MDLDIARGESFGAKAPVMLPDAATRSFSVVVKEIIYADHSVWNAGDEIWEQLPAADTLDAVLQDGELVKQYRIEYGRDCDYFPAKQKDLWYCACGRLNSETEATCHHCGKSFKQLQAADLDELKAKRDARIAEETQERQEKQAAAVVAIKKGLIAAAAVIVLIIAINIAKPIIARNSSYRQAKAMLSEGRYREAITAFEALGDYRDSAKQAQNAADAEKAAEEQARVERAAVAEQKKQERYDEAVELMEAGDMEEAWKIFSGLGDYRDSAQRAQAAAEAVEEQEKQALYDEAVKLKEAGDIKAAVAILAEMADYKDAKDLLNGISKYVVVQKINGDDVCNLYYDEIGRLIKEEAYGGNYYAYKYKDGEMVETKCDDDGDVLSKTVETYGGNGQIAKRVETYYDAFGDVTSETVETYDANGHITKKVANRHSSWDDSLIVETTTYTGNKSRSVNGDIVEECTYDDHGNITKIDNYMDGKWVSGYEYTNDYIYDEDGRLLEHITISNGNSSSEKYTYDEDGNLIAKSWTKNSGGAEEYVYGYIPYIAQ